MQLSALESLAEYSASAGCQRQTAFAQTVCCRKSRRADVVMESCLPEVALRTTCLRPSVYRLCTLVVCVPCLPLTRERKLQIGLVQNDGNVCAQLTCNRWSWTSSGVEMSQVKVITLTSPSKSIVSYKSPAVAEAHQRPYVSLPPLPFFHPHNFPPLFYFFLPALHTPIPFPHHHNLSFFFPTTCPVKSSISMPCTKLDLDLPDLASLAMTRTRQLKFNS